MLDELALVVLSANTCAFLVVSKTNTCRSLVAHKQLSYSSLFFVLVSDHDRARAGVIVSQKHCTAVQFVCQLNTPTNETHASSSNWHACFTLSHQACGRAGENLMCTATLRWVFPEERNTLACSENVLRTTRRQCEVQQAQVARMEGTATHFEAITETSYSCNQVVLCR